MAEPLVSAIIAVYNGFPDVAAAIASALAQTYPAVETIVVDDGSTDETPGILAAIDGITVISQPNAGLAAARNSGIRAARGEWLAFLDHDDTWDAGKIERQMAALAATHDAEVAFCHERYLFEGTPPLWFRGPTDGSTDICYLPSAWLVRRFAFDRVGLFDESYRYAEDTEWLARAKDAGVRTVIAPEVLLTRKIRADSQTSHTAEAPTALLQLLRASVERQRAAREP